MSYYTNIIKAATENSDYRKVMFTGTNSQLVIMSIPPGGEVGAETHKYTEQTLFFLSGMGVGELDNKTFPIGPGDMVVVVPGTEHNTSPKAVRSGAYRGSSRRRKDRFRSLLTTSDRALRQSCGVGHSPVG